MAMARKLLGLIAAGLLTVLLIGCATPEQPDSWRNGTTSISVSGPPGARITGFYVQNGTRHEFAEPLPFQLSETGIWEVVVRKVDSAQTITVETRFQDTRNDTRSANMVVPPTVPGARVELRKGFYVEHLNR